VADYSSSASSEPVDLRTIRCTEMPACESLHASRATLLSTADTEALDLLSLKPWVFDHTVEHETWNDSDRLRVVPIFDTWHSHVTPAKCPLVTAPSAGVVAFTGGSIGPES